MSIFAKLIRGNTLPAYLGIKEKVLKFGPDYTYVECKLGKVKYLNDDKTFALLKPDIAVDPKRCKIFVVPNAKLATKGQLSYQSILEPGDGKFLGITIKSEKPIDFNKIGWILRIYGIIE